MSLSFNFRYQDKPHQLPLGGSFAIPREDGFRDAGADEVLGIVSAVEHGRPWRDVVTDAFRERKPWLYRIITAPQRTAFFGSVLPAKPGPVLDIGAGWGQISRPLPAQRPVVALEPVRERMAFIRAAAKQNGVISQMAFIEADYLDLAFETRFDAICAIGVLEWAGAFQGHSDPQERQREFLRKTKTDLAPGGCLVIGIENRIGLKYLLGAPDDHIGVSNIACLPANLAAERWRTTSGHTLRSFTYSRHELAAMLRSAGFTTIEFFGAFPDYKLPERIVALGEDGKELNDWLSTQPPPLEHNGYDGSPLSAEFIAGLNAQYQSLAQDGVVHAFVPSFFVRAR